MFHNQKVSHVICISKKPSAKPHWTEQTWISASLDTAGRAILSSPLPSSLPPLLTSRSHCYGGVGGVGGGMLKMNPLSGQEHPYTERRKDFSTSQETIAFLYTSNTLLFTCFPQGSSSGTSGGRRLGQFWPPSCHPFIPTTVGKGWCCHLCCLLGTAPQDPKTGKKQEIKYILTCWVLKSGLCN